MVAAAGSLAAGVKGLEAVNPVATEVVKAVAVGRREEVATREAHKVGSAAKVVATRAAVVMAMVVVEEEARLAAAGPAGGTGACTRYHPAARSPSMSAAPRYTGSSYLRRNLTAMTVVAGVPQAAVREVAARAEVRAEARAAARAVARAVVATVGAAMGRAA